MKWEGTDLPNEKLIKSLEEGETCKCLGVVEADEVMVNELRNKVKKEYYRRVRKVLETKLNSGNVFRAINTWAVSVLRYSEAFLRWPRFQLEEIDRRTRKLLTMHHGFHSKSSVEPVYLSKSKGGKRMIGVQDIVEIAILG